MKFSATATALFAMIGSAAALAPAKKAPVKKAAVATKYSAGSGSFTLDTIPGAVAPTGPWDPWGLAAKADENLLKRYREAELAHSRVAMLAVVGFIVGEWVEGSSFLFDASVSGPAITHLTQVPVPFWSLLGFSIAYLEIQRAEIGWVPPKEVPIAQAGLLRSTYNPGELGFDPLNFKPSDPEAYLKLQNNELQNGRLAMLAAAGFLAQELTDGQGILDHLFATL